MAEMFGRYRLDELIGRGGMGEVYRAFDTERHRTVALKCLPPALAADAEFRTRFITEASLAATLHEPHIIPIHDYGDIDGRLFIDMRLVDGRDLAAVLHETGPMAPERAVSIVGQVAAALDAAHAAGMAHRDIKPGNVLLTGPAGGAPTGDFVYLADFGVARAMGDTSPPLTMAGTAVGSVDYMAPERFTGDRGDHRVDVYALGCLLFELLTARKPFEGGGAPAMLYAHLNKPAPRPSESASGVPVGLDDVVAQAMAKDPDDRYQTAGALAAAARAALAPAAFGSRALAAAALPAADLPPSTVPAGLQGPPVPLPPEYGPLTPPAGQTPARPQLPPHPGQLPPGSGQVSAQPWQFQVRPDQAPPSTGRRRRRLALVLGLVVALSAVGGGAVAVTLMNGSDSEQTLLEPVHTPGANPFMPPAGSDQVGVTPPAGSSGAFTGNTPGLYGGTRNMTSCDPDQMVTFLAAHPDEAAAWAGVEGIATSDISTYIAGLTPVILRSDTAVTNHGFRSGKATTLHSVLQAGTAVLIDAYGQPRAKCYCGNPLTAPSRTASTQLTGTRWPGFSAGSITRIQAASAPLTAFTLVDPTTNEVFTRPVGGRGSTDEKAPSAATSPASSTSPTTLSPSSEAASSSAAAQAVTQATPPPFGLHPPSPRRSSGSPTKVVPTSPRVLPTTAPAGTTSAAPPTTTTTSTTTGRTTTTTTTTTTSRVTTTTTTTTSTPAGRPPVITDTSSAWSGSTFYARVFYNDPDGDATSYSYSSSQLGSGSGSVPSGSSGMIEQGFPGACVAGVPSKPMGVTFTVHDRQKNASNSVSVTVTCPSLG